MINPTLFRFRRPRTQLKRFLCATLIVGASMATATTALAEEIYGYDALGRLISVTQDDGSTITYEYDAAGNRTKTVVAGTGVADPDPHNPLIVVVPLNGFTVIVAD